MTVYQRMRRPRNADPNTAFTVISARYTERTDMNRKARVSLDPNNLRDDSWDAKSKVSVEGPVLFGYENQPEPEQLHGSCRSFNSGKDNSNYKVLRTPEEQGLYLTLRESISPW